MTALLEYLNFLQIQAVNQVAEKWSGIGQTALITTNSLYA